MQKVLYQEETSYVSFFVISKGMKYYFFTLLKAVCQQTVIQSDNIFILTTNNSKLCQISHSPSSLASQASVISSQNLNPEAAWLGLGNPGA